MAVLGGGGGHGLIGGRHGDDGVDELGWAATSREWRRGDESPLRRSWWDAEARGATSDAATGDGPLGGVDSQGGARGREDSERDSMVLDGGGGQSVRQNSECALVCCVQK